MKTKYLLWIFFFGLPGCQEEDGIGLLTDSIKSDRYYDEEIMSSDMQDIYGKWELYDISGGIAGSGHDLDLDYLEVKSVGIYGLVRNEELFEYGKIEPGMWDPMKPGSVEIKLVAEFPSEQSSYFSVPEKYVLFSGTDTLHLISPCCDMYDYHFKRVR